MPVLFCLPSLIAKAQHPDHLAVSMQHAYLTNVSGRIASNSMWKKPDFKISLRSLWTNPVDILKGKEKLQISLHYTKGSGGFPQANYPFVGISYKITDKLSAGLSLFEWNGVKNNQGIKRNISAITKNASNAYQSFSLAAAYAFTKEIKAGIAINSLKNNKSPRNESLDLCITYDKASVFIRNRYLRNQKLSISSSLLNAKMNCGSFIRHDIPAALLIKTGYSFSFTLKKGHGHINKKIKTIDFAARLYYQDWFRKTTHIYNHNNYQSLLSVGTEATALGIFSIRLCCLSGLNHVTNKAGLHATSIAWGAGCALPVCKWFHASKLSVIKLNATTRNHPDLLEKSITQKTPRDFRDQRLLYSVGIDIKL